MEPNISFSSNVNIIKSTSQSVGDKEFLGSVTDYYALSKLKDIAGGTNTKFYIFKLSQLKILSPDFAGTVNPRMEDPVALSENVKLNNLYGYDDYNEEELYPLLDEVYLKYDKSIWDVSNGVWWNRPGFYNDRYSGDIGTWKEVAKQQGTVDLYGGGSLFTSYVKNELEKINGKSKDYIPLTEVDLSNLDEPDPYYYIYQKTAGVSEEPLNDFENKEAKAYLKKYGMFSAFEPVEQERIITANSDEVIFVDAGPGTGKTYTLINKINYMVEKLDVDPEGILVLCFTNAAVAEIKKRRDEYIANGGSRALRKVDIRTFHSFAWWLIGEANNILQDEGWEPVSMRKLSYDGSIAKAIRIIRRFREQVLGGWEHFIVDEIQDLTDVKASLVLQIINGCLEEGCGITVLGDSCQSIYDYSQADFIDPLDSQKFYRVLFMMLYGKCNFYKLTHNHRQTESLISLTSNLRESILNEKTSEMKEAAKTLHSLLPEINSMHINQTYLSNLATEGNICLLCRNNGQVLRLSSTLRKKGVDHIVNAYDHNNCYASWIGAVFSNHKKEMISFDEFECLYNRCAKTTYSAEEVWNRMSTMLKKTNNNKLGTNEILQSIYTSQIDDTIFHNHNSSNIIVSNIHKAKGREYDVVIIEDQFIKGLAGKKTKDIGEYKTLYVAATRPRKKLYTSKMVTGDSVRIFDIWRTKRKRWLKGSFKKLTHLEVRGSTDIDIPSYNMLGKDIQKYIYSNITIGDEIILRKSKTSELFRYDIIHIKDEVETIIGRATKMLEDDIEVLLDTDDRFQWPHEIRDIYVNDVYTFISENISNSNHALGLDNVWNWVDFCGLGRLVYDVY